MRLGRIAYIALAATVFSFNACATIFTSSSQSIQVSSQPTGASYQYGVYSGKTPDTINASRGELVHVITFSAPGYETKTVPVETAIQGATWWDILFPIGFAVDFASGNAYKVVNNDIGVTLSPTASAASPAPPAASVNSAQH